MSEPFFNSTQGLYNKLFINASGHVNAGTATYQLYNSTDATQITAVTTTSTSETALGQVSGASVSNVSDSIILRLKNSGAGNIVYIDHGGIGSADNIGSISGTSDGFNITFFSNKDSETAFYVGQIKYIPLKRKSTATFSGNIGITATPSGSGGRVSLKSFDTFDESEDATIKTTQATALIGSGDGAQIGKIATVTSALDTASCGMAMSIQGVTVKISL